VILGIIDLLIMNTSLNEKIDDLLCERIIQQADEYNKTYPEIIEIIKNQFYNK